MQLFQKILIVTAATKVCLEHLELPDCRDWPEQQGLMVTLVCLVSTVVLVRKVNLASQVAPRRDCLDFLERRAHLEFQEIVDMMDVQEWMEGKEKQEAEDFRACRETRIQNLRPLVLKVHLVTKVTQD